MEEAGRAHLEGNHFCSQQRWCGQLISRWCFKYLIYASVINVLCNLGHTGHILQIIIPGLGLQLFIFGKNKKKTLVHYLIGVASLNAQVAV